MRSRATFGSAGLAAALILILVGGCRTSPAAHTQALASPSAPVRTFAGGCAGTVLTDAVPPVWAQGGWSVAKGAAWPAPWAFGTHDDTVAYLFATQMLAGVSPRVDGSQNKVLWEARDSPSGGNVLVEGRPLGKSEPLVTIAGGPSITDVPLPGCWTFRLSWGANGGQSSTINLEVLPAGTMPHRLP